MRLSLKKNIRFQVTNTLYLDQGQQIKKKLLTSYIENKKFIISNKLPNNNKKFPFNSTIDRFIDFSVKEELKGNIKRYMRRPMKSSMSCENISIIDETSRKVMHKNKSQPLLWPNKVTNL